MRKTFLTGALSVLVVLALAFGVTAADRENFTVGNLTVERSLNVQGLIQGAMNTTGNVLYVDSGAGINAIGRGKTAKSPLASLAYAFSSDQLKANNGDVVVVMPGHTESIIASGTITIDIDGVTVVFLGSGSSVPTFTWSTATTARMIISAANTTFLGSAIFDMTGVDAVAMGIHITSDGYFRMIGDYKGAFRVIQADDNAGSGAGSAAVVAIEIDQNADYSLIENVTFIGPTASGEEAYSNTSTAAIDYSATTGLTNTHYEQAVKNCEFIGMWATAAVNSDYTMTKFITAGNTGKNYSPGCRLFDMSGGTNNTYWSPDMGEKTIELYAMPTPNAATTTVFTVDGLGSDSIDVLSLSGVVSTNIEAAATTISLVADPAAASLSNVFIASASDITYNFAGSMLTVGDMGGALAETTLGSSALTFTDGQQFMLSPCAIALWSVNDTTGAITWRMRYRPNSPSVFVY